MGRKRKHDDVASDDAQPDGSDVTAATSDGGNGFGLADTLSLLRDGNGPREPALPKDTSGGEGKDQTGGVADG